MRYPDFAHAQSGGRTWTHARTYAISIDINLDSALNFSLSLKSVRRLENSLPYEAAYERYQQLQCYMNMKMNVAILLKRLRSRDIA